MTNFAKDVAMTAENNAQNPTNLQRRSTDGVNHAPTNKELLDAILNSQQEITAVKTLLSGMQDAFLDNDLGKKDYEGHRQDHLKRKVRDQQFESMKMAGTLKLVGIVVGVVFAIFATGFSVHIQKLFGQSSYEIKK